ncbi:acetyltransferase [Bacillus methanolicus]|uniref:acyltransferase n=1 Tax=Bacillus methanolicus TaxID=1471 RepID=UPI0024B12CF0|nr:acetyltransferase [Bacillus methanolicus]UQD53491.1 acetyltransferase [Bacillus methanolicus]
MRKKVTFENLIAMFRGIILLKIHASSVKKLPRIRGKIYLKNNGKLIIGNYFSVTSKPLPVSITVENQEAVLVIGDNVFINYGVDIGCNLSIFIGNNVKIGPLTNIIDSNYHQIDMDDEMRPKKIKISDKVWIGRQCIILPGVTIGENSVIASGSIVTKDVPPNVLVAGSPAKVIRPLNIGDNWARK